MRGGLFDSHPLFFLFFPPSLSFFHSPRVLLISLWGCGWRPWSVGNDARSFNYRNGWTSVRKTDRGKKGDRFEEKQRSTPTPSPFPSRFGQEVQRYWRERAEHSPALGERPEPCRLFAINFFWKPFSPSFFLLLTNQ